MPLSAVAIRQNRKKRKTKHTKHDTKKENKHAVVYYFINNHLNEPFRMILDSMTIQKWTSEIAFYFHRTGGAHFDTSLITVSFWSMIRNVKFFPRKYVRIPPPWIKSSGESVFRRKHWKIDLIMIWVACLLALSVSHTSLHDSIASPRRAVSTGRVRGKWPYVIRPKSTLNSVQITSLQSH